MVMQRIIEKGQKVIGEDVRKLRKVLEERKGSPTAIDGVKVRLNVFQLLAPEQDPKSKNLRRNKQVRLKLGLRSCALGHDRCYVAENPSYSTRSLADTLKIDYATVIRHLEQMFDFHSPGLK
jgi:hypothetical protein